MASFCMKIAGHTAQVNSLFQSTQAHFARYLTEDEPEFFVTVTAEDLVFEQEEALKEAREEGFKPRIFPDPFLERAAIQRSFAEFLLDHDTLLLHGSTVAVDGKAYLFTAKSGTGKSTHTRLWREAFGESAVMINDDKPFLHIGQEGVTAYGAPWSGKHGLDSNTDAPLKGICILVRGDRDHIEKADPEEARQMLCKQCYCPLDEARLPKQQALIDALAKAVPLWHMHCTKDPGSPRVAFDAMSK